MSGKNGSSPKNVHANSVYVALHVSTIVTASVDVFLTTFRRLLSSVFFCTPKPDIGEEKKGVETSRLKKKTSDKNDVETWRGNNNRCCQIQKCENHDKLPITLATETYNTLCWK